MDYSLTYKNNTLASSENSIPTVTITGKGSNFTGTITKEFNIVNNNNVAKTATGIQIKRDDDSELINGKIYVNIGAEQRFKVSIIGDDDCDDSLKLNSDAANGYYTAKLEDISTDGKTATLVVKGSKVGGATIRLVSKSGSVNIPYDVIVNAPATKVAIKLENIDALGRTTTTDVTNKDQYLYIDHNYSFKAALSPGNSTDSITWSINNDSIATIDPETGVMQTKGIGSLIVRATTNPSEVSPGGVFAEVPITIQENIAIQSITLDCEEKELQVGKTFTLKATYLPTDYTEQLSWVSTDEKVAKVETNGKVTAVGNGTC